MMRLRTINPKCPICNHKLKVYFDSIVSCNIPVKYVRVHCTFCRKYGESPLADLEVSNKFLLRAAIHSLPGDFYG